MLHPALRSGDNISQSPATLIPSDDINNPAFTPMMVATRPATSAPSGRSALAAKEEDRVRSPELLVRCDGLAQADRVKHSSSSCLAEVGRVAV